MLFDHKKFNEFLVIKVLMKTRQNYLLYHNLVNMIKSIEGYSYKVNESIGKGYSSTVHKGKNDHTGEEVSIKVIEMSKLEDPINEMLLKFQITALKSLTSSSNVLHLYDVYSTKNNTYIITELMQGDLHTLLKERKQFPYYEAVEIIKQIISGYFDVYQSGFLHRDIKPANIFYRNGAYKIGDFGFAIPAKDANQHRDYNVGSPVYMPPEALKENKFSHSCDTWAIGVIFFQLLKGLVPWRAISEPKLYDKIMNEPLSDLTVGLPEVARVFLSHVINLDPSQRMSPEQLATWPDKLFAVQIRSTMPSQYRPPLHKVALQQIQGSNNVPETVTTNYSRSKSYTSNQVPNYVSGLRSNMPNGQRNESQQHQNQSKMTQNLFLAPSRNNNSNIGNYQSAKHVPAVMKLPQKASTIFTAACENLIKQQPAQGKNVSFSAQFYGTNMISYLKFIHRVIKFISNPTQTPLRDLELSLTKMLFKEIQMIRKFTDSQNSQVASSDINGWKQFSSSKDYNEKFSKKLQLLSQKYKMFNVLPNDDFVLEVYREQLLDGITKIYTHLQNQTNYSEKSLISLDYLVSFYQVWNFKEKQGKNFSLKEFLNVSRFDKIMEVSPYNVKKQHFIQLKNKMIVLGLVDSGNQSNNLAFDLPRNQQPLKNIPETTLLDQRVMMRF